MTASIIEKWYKALNFPVKYDEEFYKALNEIEIPSDLTADSYPLDSADGKKNLLAYLYFCEKLQSDYEEAKISREILMDTLSDIVRWTNTWSDIKGELYLGELEFLKCHMDVELFKIGRLEFYPKPLLFDIPQIGAKAGDTVVTVHIPSGEKLVYEECVRSLERAKEFYARHFPNLDYKCFLCTSWLMDGTLSEILPSDSNILKFQTIFKYVRTEESDAIIHYVFGWDKTIADLETLVCKTNFAKGVKNRLLNGGKFYKTSGYYEK